MGGRRLIRTVVDARIELLAVVQLLADCRGPGGSRVLTRLEFPYLREVRRRFCPHSRHPVIAQYQEMHEHGFWFGHPPHAMLFLSEPPDLAIRKQINPFVVGRAGGESALEALIRLLRRFAGDTCFMEFFHGQQSFYQEMVARYQDMVSGFNYVDDLEAYYGQSQASYTIILAPIYHPGGFGLRVERSPDSFDTYNISGPYDVDCDGVPTFGGAAELRRIVWHEFGHSYVNHLIERHLDIVREPCSALLSGMRARVEQAPNVDWDTFIHEWVSEHVVRAVTTRLAYLGLGNAAGDAALEKEHRQGYAYVGELTKELRRYECNRTEYRSLESFLPELFDVFRRAVPSS